MSNEQYPRQRAGRSTVYQLRIEGHLGSQWMEWFDGLTITLTENGDTLLTGQVIDQAALHGILKKIRDLGMPLLSVNVVDPNQPDMAGFDKPLGLSR
jgi:hypothetical protein